MLAYTYISPGKFELIDKPKPELQSPQMALLKINNSLYGNLLNLNLHSHFGDGKF